MGRALLVLDDPDIRDVRNKAIDWINRAPVGTRVEFKASKRSLPQNDRLWAMLTDVQTYMKAKEADYSTDQWKVIFLHAWGKEIEFLPGLDGKTFVPYGQSSSDLSKEEMTDFIEFIMAWGAENGVTFHDPKNNEAPGVDSPLSTPADDDASGPADRDDRTSSAPTDFSPSSVGASITPETWLLNVARMLWAVAIPGGDFEVLKNQKRAALIEFPKPDDCPERIAGKANSVFNQCGQIIDGSLDPGDGLALIAGIVGVDQDDIRRKAGK